MYTGQTQIHTLSLSWTSSKTDTEYGYFQCGSRMFYILLKFFLTQYLSSVMSENKGILESSQLMVV